jgi:hypothetical protein
MAPRSGLRLPDIAMPTEQADRRPRLAVAMISWRIGLTAASGALQHAPQTAIAAAANCLLGAEHACHATG